MESTLGWRSSIQSFFEISVHVPKKPFSPRTHKKHQHQIASCALNIIIQKLEMIGADLGRSWEVVGTHSKTWKTRKSHFFKNKVLNFNL